jgi:hypothetical protein
MSRRFNRRAPPPNVRLTSEGTRVVVLKGGAPHPVGVISDVRLQTHLKAYVVTCDDGRVVYASGCDLAREDDGAATPLGPQPVE